MSSTLLNRRKKVLERTSMLLVILGQDIGCFGVRGDGFSPVLLRLGLIRSRTNRKLCMVETESAKDGVSTVLKQDTGKMYA